MSRSGFPRATVGALVVLVAAAGLVPANAATRDGGLDAWQASVERAANNPAVRQANEDIARLVSSADASRAFSRARTYANVTYSASALPKNASAEVSAKAYLKSVAHALQTRAHVPTTGDPAMDPFVAEVNQFLDMENTAVAATVLASLMVADSTRRVVESRIAALTAGGQLHPRELFWGPVANLSRLPAVTAGLGSIIGAVATIAAGAVGVACALTACGVVGAVVAGGLAVVAGTAWLIDEFSSNTQAAVACVVKADMHVDAANDTALEVVVARCPKNQADLSVEMDEHNTKMGTGINTNDCTNTTSCSVTWTIWPISGNCTYLVGTFKASNGTPPTGQDTSGAYCRP